MNTEVISCSANIIKIIFFAKKVGYDCQTLENWCSHNVKAYHTRIWCKGSCFVVASVSNAGKITIDLNLYSFGEQSYNTVSSNFVIVILNLKILGSSFLLLPYENNHSHRVLILFLYEWILINLMSFNEHKNINWRSLINHEHNLKN